MRIRWIAASLAVLTALGTAAVRADERTPEKVQVFTLDVAEDFTGKFVYTPVDPTDTIPKRGANFLTEGNVFPGGTIQGDGSDFDPYSPGSIGHWYCRGVHIVDGDQVPDAPLWVNTVQSYALPDTTRMLTSEGLEGSQILMRAVTGGTGTLKGVVGEQRQELLGFNITGGVNLRVTFTVRQPDKP